MTIDIEVSSEHGFPDVESCQEEILAITIQDYATKKITTWGVKPFVNKQDNVTYYHCPSEHELLSHFINHWMNDVPDVITGWNCQLYDIPYICKRIRRVLGEKLMKRCCLTGDWLLKMRFILMVERHLHLMWQELLSLTILICIRSSHTRHRNHIVLIILLVLSWDRKT